MSVFAFHVRVRACLRVKRPKPPARRGAQGDLAPHIQEGHQHGAAGSSVQCRRSRHVQAGGGLGPQQIQGPARVFACARVCVGS